jgi:hypothetical protein
MGRFRNMFSNKTAINSLENSDNKKETSNTPNIMISPNEEQKL